MSCRLSPWNQESLKKNIFYVTTYDKYSYYIWVTIIAHIPWISYSMNFGQCFGTFDVEDGNGSNPKLDGKNSTD